jgi:L-threonylcarbamoyladenylate synthase
MMAIHYAPTTPAVRCSNDLLPVFLLAWEDKKIGVLTCGSNIPSTPNRTVISVPIDSVIYAQNLYAKLRELDALNVDLILVEQPPQSEAWHAINDRLSKATQSVS